MAGSAVNNRAVSNVLAVVDHDGPEVDEDEKRDRGKLVQREQHGENVVRERLSPAVDGVESVRGVRGRHDPLVVRLVEVLVDERVVETSVDQVDAGIGEDDEKGVLKNLIRETWTFGNCVIKLRPATNFHEPKRDGQHGHAGHRLVRLLNLEPHLVLEVFGVVHSLLVEDEPIR